MLRRVSSAICVLAMTGAAVAQNASAAPVKAVRLSLCEQLLKSETERMRWEAAQTWNRPVVPNPNTEPPHRAIHIDQLPPAVPKIRREWLQPSSEAFTPGSAGLDQLLNEQGSEYVQKRTR